MWSPRLRLEVPQATLRDQQEHRKPQALSPSAAPSPMRGSEASNGETHRDLPQEPRRDIPYRVSTLGPLSAAERDTLQPPQRPHGALRDLMVPHGDLAQRFPESSHREPHRGHTERLHSVPQRPPANVRDLPWFSHRDLTQRPHKGLRDFPQSHKTGTSCRDSCSSLQPPASSSRKGTQQPPLPHRDLSQSPPHTETLPGDLPVSTETLYRFLTHRPQVAPHSWPRNLSHRIPSDIPHRDFVELSQGPHTETSSSPMVPHPEISHRDFPQRPHRDLWKIAPTETFCKGLIQGPHKRQQSPLAAPESSHRDLMWPHRSRTGRLGFPRDFPLRTRAETSR